jgi:2-polyprenyl-3-methyl-5-hydroxy-6-metoxy-1,4-benzoquinol methylase
LTFSGTRAELTADAVPHFRVNDGLRASIPVSYRMICCPECGQPLASIEPGCGHCGRQIAREGTIAILAPQAVDAVHDYDPARLDRLRRVEDSHPWFVYRRDLIRRLFKRHVPHEARVLDIGAGTGATAAALQRDGYANIAVADLHVQGLRYAAEQGLAPLFQVDLTQPAFRDEFDAVSMFDVLEHFAEPTLVLRNVADALKPRGLLLLTVPALGTLWSAHDVAAGHYRRYRRATLRSDLTEGGFEIIDCRYFFAHMLPLLMLRRVLYPAGKNAKETTGQADDDRLGFNLPASLQRALRIAAIADRLLISLGGPAGGSLYAVARKT